MIVLGDDCGAAASFTMLMYSDGQSHLDVRAGVAFLNSEAGELEVIFGKLDLVVVVTFRCRVRQVRQFL